jgi:hypothetical protein
MDDWDLFEAIDIEDLSSIIALGAVGEARDLRAESGTSEPNLSGADYLRDLLNCGNHKRIYSVLRMPKDTFDKLCSWMRRGVHWEWPGLKDLASDHDRDATTLTQELH